MCRMFFQCSEEPFQLDDMILKKFISSCYWTYFRRYNLIGHHHLGFGIAYILEGKNHLIIKRSLTPIYKADWKGLLRIKTRFLLVHARKAYPWKKSREDIHPIDIKEKFLITHNGTIHGTSFPRLKDKRLERIKNSTSLDTRKYLCYIMDVLKKKRNIKETLEEVLRNIKIGIAANAFLFNANQCNVINYHANKFTGRHRTLFIHKKRNMILVGTTPLKKESHEIPNKTLIQINLNSLSMQMQSLHV
ncbi:MAG: class II glutamine amidotransferase [Promethearchaeota archaeon]